jgi:succinate dehydrogenase/fumarate reductase iron-sulfur protein
MTKSIEVRIKRYDSSADEEAYFDSYEVPIDDGTTVLSVLRYVFENLDHSVAFYSSCRIGKCVGCLVKVNGKTKLACSTVVHGDITLEPQPKYRVVKDLVVDKRIAAQSTSA